MSLVVVEETIRRHVTHVGYLTYLALLAIVSLGVSRFDHPAAVWPQLVSILAIITGAGPIGPEFSSGTLQLVLVKPVNRAAYLLSRVAGVVAVVWLAAVVAFSCEAIGRLAAGSVPWRQLSITLLNVSADAILTVSLLAMVGSLTRAYFNVAVYMGLQIGLSIGVGLLALARHPMIGRVVSVVDRNLFPELPAALDRDWLLMVLSNAAVALVLGCLAFRRREVPYGAD